MSSLAAVPTDLINELVDAGLDPDQVRDTIDLALREDLPDGPPDPTSWATIGSDERGEAVFAAREPGVVAGLGVAAAVFHAVHGRDVDISERLADGTRVERGDVVMRVAGHTRQLLVAERVALNLACHLSGIATATARWVDALEGSPTRVLDTRKTLPGLRALQKYAVRCGGGVNHRFGLFDMAMVKDNHVLAAGGVVPALDAIREQHPDLPVEVEVTTLDQLDELLALDRLPDRILLDNMSDELMADAVRRTAGRVPLEASGGITLERASRIGATGVDFVSVGALTHSVVVFDIGMDLLPGRASQS
ncbi:carboxylating nicotinate-nucleotide diphosphorylase [Nocardioides seonyuensis]|uniref:Nicotinate-nucleotide pyrophosphorylase [carboxylating] n=1 Tax=Nocardioides seonyuensis TaxID=2518371 RepID=A0A4P7ICU7_9ACTN|nr:carboxylating nicotinate-nucleotide diphosphorylase [Nocardioides seonyuensis]QBX54955.1 carboxylating nicotinate-nucleotide diphosphorylase [Nocardioides seonyuensis]